MKFLLASLALGLSSFAAGVDVVLKADARDSALFVVDQSGVLSPDATTKSMDPACVSQLVASALGAVPPLSGCGAHAPLVRTSLFKRPLANLVVSVDAVGVKSITNFADYLPNLRSLQGGDAPTLAGQTFGLRLQADHGVDSSELLWDMSAGSGHHVNVVDSLLQSFKGSSFAASVSADPGFVSAFCLQPTLRASHPSWTSLCESATGSAAELSRVFQRGGEASVLTALSLADAGLTLDFEAGAVTVRFAAAGGETAARLDLSSEPVRALLGELQLVHTLLGRLSTDEDLAALLRDDAPDLVAVSLSSLPAVAAAYGDGSPTQLSALRLLDAAVGMCHARVSLLYPGRLLTQVVALGQGPARSVATQRRLLAVQAAATAGNGTNSTVTVAEIAEYQIMVWLSIGLAFTLIAAASCLGCMTNKKDTLLYSTFNPKWDDRKQK